MDIRHPFIRNLALIAAIAVCAVWGETFVSSKILLQAGLLPSEIFFIRFCLAYLFMCLFAHKRWRSASWKDELLLLMLGLTGGSLYFLSENMALMYSTASNVAILVGTTPLVTALLLSLFFREERMNARQLTGSFIAFLGMILVILNGRFVLHLNPKGDVLALGASVAWGIYSLIIKRLSSTYDSLFITRKVFGYGIVTLLPYFLWAGPPHPGIHVLARPEVWGNLLYLGLIASLLCYFVWNWSLTQLGTVRATNVIYLQSFFTMLFSHFILGEQITIMAIAGTIILVVGMAWASKKQKTDIKV